MDAAAVGAPLPFDHDLLVSVASGLGRWTDGGAGGAPVYVKDEDCVGEFRGGGKSGEKRTGGAAGGARVRASCFNQPLPHRRAPIIPFL